MLATVAVENYRSLRQLVVPLGQLNAVTGPNGSGKSNLYRALRLLADSARNGAVAALAREGGLSSTMWAGPAVIGKSVRQGRHQVQGTVRTGPASLRLGFAGDDFGYAMDFGLPVTTNTAFGLDPEVKVEALWVGPVWRKAAVIAERGGPTARVRDGDGNWHVIADVLRPFDSMLSELADPVRAPELIQMRERTRYWRFYDHLRTDADAPARQIRIGTRTPVLGHDGADLAAAIQTIREIGDDVALSEAIDRAFEGCRIEIRNMDTRFELVLHQPGMLRPLAAAELSDGTLRYLLWTAALLTPRPPQLLVLNEPETSLHPELLPALASLVATAANRSQIIVVTHSESLVAALQAAADVHTVRLTKELGETRIAGQNLLDQPSWHWPPR
ncbi:AAA family ATPase [Mycobacterium riyadhense]|uniref:ATP-binding protein n=1 Tax=Mycobacterium riyadhense TaxID=486698 RepID=A0A1X2CRF7_9MYCO|nr:AAA family ATPase [Mycobacterium riyadhense]MCV7145487.1 AAA family ATPase [Mycobacterium riyadhense]ORW78548.1 ATP-binding protein [Mycobacterium riyadhense]